MASPVGYTTLVPIGKIRSVGQTMVDGRRKRLVLAKGHTANKCTLIGDSIIQFIQQCSYTSVQSIPGLYAKNLVDVIRRGVLTISDFKAIVFLIGTNDMTRSTLPEIVAIFEEIINFTRSRNPLARIAISCILPRPCDAGSPKLIKKRVSVNNGISHLCRRLNVQYIKTEICLKNAGPDDKVFMPDKIHLADPAVKLLKTYLEGRFGSLVGITPQWTPFPLNRR